MKQKSCWLGTAAVGAALLLTVGVGRAQAAEDTGVRQGLFSVGGATSAAVVFPNVDHTNSTSTTWALAGSFGYFVADPLSLDVLPSALGNFDGDYALSLHFGGTYHLLPRQALTPYLQGAVGFTHSDLGGTSDTSGSFIVGGGLKYFVTHNVALDMGLKYIAPFDNADQGALPISVGLAVYF